RPSDRRIQQCDRWSLHKQGFAKNLTSPRRPPLRWTAYRYPGHRYPRGDARFRPRSDHPALTLPSQLFVQIPPALPPRFRRPANAGYLRPKPIGPDPASVPESAAPPRSSTEETRSPVETPVAGPAWESPRIARAARRSGKRFAWEQVHPES